MHFPATLFDVAIIGGGPAGSVAGTLLAQAGFKTIILEKEKFPRFRVGESMLPGSSAVLDRIDVKPKIDSAGFVVKEGGEIIAACGQARAKFLFKNGFNPRWKTSYQVEREKFDQILLDHAQESGCRVHDQCPVTGIDLGPDHVTLRCRGNAEIRARYILDCSGRNSLLAHQLKLKEPIPQLKKFSVFAYYQLTGNRPEPQFTRMIRGADAWFWIIPLANHKCSFGVVLDAQRFKSLRVSPEELLTRTIAEQPEVNAWLDGAERYTPVRATSDFSYRTRRLRGDRWLLAGDAAGFVDPVFSSGLHLALVSGEHAGDALVAALRDPARKQKMFRRYETDLQSRLSAYVKLSTYWYTSEFIEVFLHPKEIWQIVPTVNAVLGGASNLTWSMRLQLHLFFGLVAIQKWTRRLVPRLSLRPRTVAKPEVAV